MQLANGLLRQNNNFDLIRLIAACAVIFGHAYALVPRAGEVPPEIVLRTLGFDYSGSLAVKLFFFLSGLVVTDSVVRNANPINFFISRIFRIFPALIVCVFLTALVLGPLVTSLALTEYFKSPEITQYLVKNINLNLHWTLPGVFTKHKITGVNGSLWTLPLEVFCYSVLFALSLVGTVKSKLVGSLTMLGIIGLCIFFPQTLQNIGFGGEAVLFPACFALGSLFAINKDSLMIRLDIFLGLLLLLMLFRKTPLFMYLFYAAFFYGALVIALLPIIQKIKPPGDYSYGIYIYGFPIQQSMVFLAPEWGVYRNQLATLVVVILLAAMSWYLIERPSIQFGKYLMGKLQLLKRGSSK